MSIVIFLIILSALVIVHELGHFSVAKYFGIRVDEFGLGYPPLAKKMFSWRGTNFTLNWLPFGGFVKIFGESYDENKLVVEPPSDSFQAKNRGIQASVLVAGVVGNFFFAWGLFFLGFTFGLPAPEGMGLPVSNPRTTITMVMPASPAELAGLRSGDVILSIDGESLSPVEVVSRIAKSDGVVDLELGRGDRVWQQKIEPVNGLVDGQKAIGVSMESVGVVKLPLHKALYQGFAVTFKLTLATGQALIQFFSEALTGRADLSSVAGPVGLVGMVGEVSELGFRYLLTFTALISINLCLINLLPLPALDGGRIVLVAVEALTRRKISPRIFNLINTAGFAMLILLMILVTINDVGKIL